MLIFIHSKLFLKEEFKVKYRKIIEEALQSGNDLYILSDNSFKQALKLSHSDIIKAKVVLTYKDGQLRYRVIEYEEPFSIIGRTKIREKGCENSNYYYLYIPSTSKYTINDIRNRVQFDTFDALKQYFRRYKNLTKLFRDYYLLNIA